MAENAVGSKLFSTFYVELPSGEVIDALSGGQASCAAFVSGMLTMLGKAEGFHGTVGSTVEDLQRSGWRPATDIQPADVLVWEPLEIEGETYRHIGFALSASEAVSTSYRQGIVVCHDIYFGEERRAIEQVYRLPLWED